MRSPWSPLSFEQTKRIDIVDLGCHLLDIELLPPKLSVQRNVQMDPDQRSHLDVRPRPRRKKQPILRQGRLQPHLQRRQNPLYVELTPREPVNEKNYPE